MTQNSVDIPRSGLARINEAIWFWVKTHRPTMALLVALVFAVQMVAVYSKLSSTTVFTSNDALNEFREKAVDAAVVPAEGEQGAQDPANAAGGQQGPVRQGSEAGSQGPAAADPSCDWVCPTTLDPPTNGVYEYFQCGRTTGQCTGAENEPKGSESIEVVSRDLPRRGQRILSTIGPRAWTNTHIYAEEHREEFDLFVNESGVFNTRYKVNIDFGPFAGGNEMRQDPPLQFAQWPMSKGLAWKGSWRDLNKNADADYSCQAANAMELNIGVTAVRTWMVQCHLDLKGPNNVGKVDLSLWLAPQYRNTVQEVYNQDIDTPDGRYRGNWMVTLANLQPST